MHPARTITRSSSRPLVAVCCAALALTFVVPLGFGSDAMGLAVAKEVGTPSASPGQSAGPPAAPPHAAVAASGAPLETQVPGEPGRDTVGLFGATTLAFADDLSDPTIWFTGDRDADRYAYEHDAYVVEVKNNDIASWSWRTLAEPHPVLRIEGTVQTRGGVGAGGYMCGAVTGDQPAFVFGDVTTNREWVMGTIANGATTVRARGPLPSGADPAAGPLAVTLECAMTSDGGDRAVMSVDGTRVADVQVADVIGPFDRVAVYSGDGFGPFTAVFDDLSAFVGDTKAAQANNPAATAQPAGSPLPDQTPSASQRPTPAPTRAPTRTPTGTPAFTPAPTPAPTTEPSAAAPPSMSPQQQALGARVPSAFRDTCVPADPLSDTAGQVGGITCRPAGAADVAWYYEFESVASMDAAFDAYRPADLAGTDCKQGPSVETYTIGGASAGRLACYVSTGSNGAVQFQWTDEVLKILSFSRLGSGSYPDLFAWWLEGGPNR